MRSYRSLRLSVGLGFLVVAIWLGASYAVAQNLTRRERPVFEEPLPSLVGAEVSEHRLRTADGQELGAWFFLGHEKGPSIVLLHGKGGSRTGLLPKAKWFVGLGCSVVVPSLRAHGDSTGEENDFGRSAAADVVAALDLLEKLRPGSSIVIVGSSLGAAATLFAVEEWKGRVSGLVLECPYTDLASAVRARTTMRLPKPLDWVAARGLLTVAPLVLEDPGGIAPVEFASKVAGIPTFVLAGARDEHAPLTQVRRLFEKLGEPKQLVVFQQSGHERLLETEPDLYAATLGDLLSRLSDPN